jgi:hypothetical protein
MIVGAGPNRETVFGICARDGCMPKTKPKPKLTDAERRKRFVEMAREVQASEDPKDFERPSTRSFQSNRRLQKRSSAAQARPNPIGRALLFGASGLS